MALISPTRPPTHLCTIPRHSIWTSDIIHHITLDLVDNFKGDTRCGRAQPQLVILFNCILMDKVWFVSYPHALGVRVNQGFHGLGVTRKPIPSWSRCEGMTQTKPEAFDRISMDILVFLHERIYKGGMKFIRYN